MFKGYMDESDSGDDALQAFVVAGFAGNEKECERVESAWKELVKPIVEFHGKNFLDRKSVV